MCFDGTHRFVDTNWLMSWFSWIFQVLVVTLEGFTNFYYYLPFAIEKFQLNFHIKYYLSSITFPGNPNQPYKPTLPPAPTVLFEHVWPK